MRTRRELELENERAAQKRYAQKLEEGRQYFSSVSGPRNSLWTGTGVRPQPPVFDGQLVGRIALAQPNQIIDGNSEFYIGERHCSDLNGVEVFGWAAPVACTFFRGREHHALCDEVAVVRAFVHRIGEIVDFDDEKLRDDAPAEPFLIRGLSVPLAPKRPGSEHSELSVSNLPAPSSLTTAPVMRGELDAEGRDRNSRGIRVESLLMGQLHSPRTERLVPVLSTLQPDQYELVSLAAGENTIVEGKPGTGKTIIASHRAAYLVNEETPPGSALDDDVLIVGPTREYSNHVREAIHRLSRNSSRIKILSMPELTQHILGLRQDLQGRVSRTWHEVDKQLAKYAWSAIDQLIGDAGGQPTVQDVYEHLRMNGTPKKRITHDEEWSSYLKSIPAYSEAIKYRAQNALLAYIQWKLHAAKDLVNIRHIIVDEAQDVTPLEWYLLAAINSHGSWTIMGDLNQRRSDHTWSSWNQVIDVIEKDPSEVPVRTLDRGYRSTRPILAFANRLLPRSDRTLLVLQQEGPLPSLHKVRAGDIGMSCIAECEQLLADHPHGTVAVIDCDPRRVPDGFRKAGWVLSRKSPCVWEFGERRVTVLQPDASRGLEFDGVVVVEPADFPENFGRHGLLYTALTRANRALSVVHTKPLPRPLR
ncbi:UvrD-helicase domain-containing protein [Pseudarthrobacter sp. BRE9]|uniref:UvrD-helicase domain-containing protein n=1 Tax=Pseudarthrobacter sp. BRE9 TaxID=2962582 RepID=UPI0028813646|nr:UvrD-helicase domain-containing protein [Pseudarthrobacter sp. BRE9]MDT0169736.1 AAA family ATPase [Pseudarthrobacter sp. BRE9]